ncbi:DUF1499 domain-containing protein [Mesorhizobium sp. NBSH29]|uniref:DUF1499 domain-containing protein n=1 Tax=Mesorhizobium sp. NBSH29 TaxID=2654249 RepID=UPI0018969B68|nr:DUF1499 domain-containing protein [Mesorhizobium sp. NBSH29]
MNVTEKARMAVYFEPRRARGAAWSRRFGIFAGLLFLMAALGHRLDLLATPDFLTVLSVAAALAGLALLCAAASFRRVWNHGDAGGRDLVTGVAVALLVLAPVLVALVLSVRLPPLNDITTDLADPPPLESASLQRPSGAAALQTRAYPEITGRSYVLDMEQVAAAARKLAEESGWQKQGDDTVTDTVTTMHWVAKTPILAFPSDVTIRVTDEGVASYVDMRSASRFGRNDLGDNARRIAGFLDALDTAIAIRSGALPAQ